jgi:N-methylhydantoinase A
MDGYVVATDMGGTFVDAVIWDLGARTCHIAKAPTTPGTPAAGILAAVAAAAERAGTTLHHVVSQAALFLNGTTVTTNAMIERKGARTGLLITAGFEDTLAIGNVAARTAGLDEAQLLDYRHAERPPPMVERRLVRGIVERIDAAGSEVVPLDEAQAIATIDELVGHGIAALAICFLWSFRAPAHEQRVKALITERHPHLYVVASSDLMPVLREYERANTTAVNAFLGEVFRAYATGLRDRLRAEACREEPLIMQSVGGLAPAAEIERQPIATLFSGPVGGVIAGAALARDLGERHLITTDMGGTSFDVGIIHDGAPVTAAETVIERQVVAIPTVEIVTVGAGGGSIAKVDDLGLLLVGPESAGSVPGPACYGRGGSVPTVTDADVVLGYIDPDFFLGGGMAISRPRAEAAVGRIAARMGMEVIEAAAAIYRIVNARMADLIRRATVERGHDPRDFVMAAFGGCGPTHCTGYGPEIGTRRLVVPQAATVFSAFGIGRSDIRHTWVRAVSGLLRDAAGRVVDASLPALQATIGELMALAHAKTADGLITAEHARISLGADIRYRNQVHELPVPLPAGGLSGTAALEAVVRAFEAGYERRYGSGASSARAPIEWVNLRLDLLAPTRTWPDTPPKATARHPLAAAEVGRKPIYDIARGRLREAPVYQAERLQPGHEIDGLALIVSYGTTIPLHEGQSLRVDGFGNLHISV